MGIVTSRDKKCKNHIELKRRLKSLVKERNGDVTFIEVKSHSDYVFFGFGYPEIIKNNFSETSCNIIRKWNIPSYCCYKQCGNICNEASFNVSTCVSLLNSWNSLDPMNCNDRCPSYDETSSCKDGYRCCAQNCIQSCSKSNSCTTQCNCISWVWNVKCRILCPLCYTTIIEVKYDTIQGVQISNNTNYFGQDKIASENYMNSFLLTTPIKCFYDPKNVLNILFDVNYTVRTWSIVGLAILLFYLSLIALTLYCSIEYYSFAQEHWLNIVLCLWFGTIPPIILISVSHTPNVNTNVLYLISLFLITIFWTNVPFVEWKKKIDNIYIIWIIIIGSFIIPFLLFGLLGIFLKSNYNFIFIGLAITTFILSISISFFWKKIDIIDEITILDNSNEEREDNLPPPPPYTEIDK
ncbi:787_t:CDS:2 [Cetraspora pellucida]|uniref:787_t:CDS:1 n=1 Tax=Cetraspora pellucida TaxID=1433469 RepID=A0ACA9KBS0_9GLOM|nr:787_t:CDS:2 [Cetraspora pellucida]